MKTGTWIGASALVLAMAVAAGAGDWPIFKGNIYFTGNNDEIMVKNGNLKWLFQAEEIAHNPIVSDGRVYFLDMKKTVYCLDEETGKKLWSVNLKQVAERFGHRNLNMGKVKYPLVRGQGLFITDSYVIYCLDKRDGTPRWARTGMRDEQKIHEPKGWKTGKSGRWQPGDEANWDPAKTSRALVDGIYADPVINDDLIYYGTRSMFISREIVNGRIRWKNERIRSFSGFPSFYDTVVFTQSMDYAKGIFSLLCLRSGDGSVVWEKMLKKPGIIYSPVVYDRRVYLATDGIMRCFDLDRGDQLWERSYDGIITSNPSFTERQVLFTLNNRAIVLIDPANGAVLKTIDLGAQSSPSFVTIRDMVYAANSFRKNVGKGEVPYASLKAFRFDSDGPLWEFVPPFPGAAAQPAASKGIMFLPAGNYLYAVGTDYYARIIDGGDGNYLSDRKGIDKKDGGDKGADSKRPDDGKKQDDGRKNDGDRAKPAERTMTVTVKDRDGAPLSATLQIRKWDRGKLVYEREVAVKGTGTVTVPDDDSVEITASAADHIPKKVVVNRTDTDKAIDLDRIEKGKSIVVDNILFEVNEAYLTKESLNILDRFIDLLRRETAVKLEVRGHTDSTGTREHNLKLSRRRADAVRDYLMKNGISPERLGAAGMGPDKPIAPNETEAGRRKNRRTEFFIREK